MCERVLASGAAMVIEALSLCFHLACFQVRGHDGVAVAAVSHCQSQQWQEVYVGSLLSAFYSFNQLVAVNQLI